MEPCFGVLLGRGRTCLTSQFLFIQRTSFALFLSCRLSPSVLYVMCASFANTLPGPSKQTTTATTHTLDSSRPNPTSLLRRRFSSIVVVVVVVVVGCRSAVRRCCVVRCSLFVVTSTRWTPYTNCTFTITTISRMSTRLLMIFISVRKGCTFSVHMYTRGAPARRSSGGRRSVSRVLEERVGDGRFWLLARVGARCTLVVVVASSAV